MTFLSKKKQEAATVATTTVKRRGLLGKLGLKKKSKKISQTLETSVADKVKEQIPDGLKEMVPQGLNENIPVGLKEQIPDGLKDKLPDGLTKQGTPVSPLEALEPLEPEALVNASDIKDDLEKNIPADLQEKLSMSKEDLTTENREIDETPVEEESQFGAVVLPMDPSPESDHVNGLINAPEEEEREQPESPATPKGLQNTGLLCGCF